MNLKVLVDRNACFYFWIQAVSGWDPSLISEKTRNYYAKDLTRKELLINDEIKSILQESSQPRWVLSDLYSGTLLLPEAKHIAKIAEPLGSAFEPLWEEALPLLKKARLDLEQYELNKFTDPMSKVTHFLASSFNPEDTHTLYLVNNMPGYNAWGLSIARNALIMVAPSRSGMRHELRNSISIIAHEYIHAIEFQSSISRELINNSYNKDIKPHNLPHPTPYKWRMMYVEAIAHCFVSPIIGGYLRPELFDKERPTIPEMESGFWKLVEEKTQTTEHIISWVALNILSDVEEYINSGKELDQYIVDKIGQLFAEFYLTHTE